MSTEKPLRLSFDAEPRSVALARAAVAEFAEALDMQEAALGDLKTIVSEACANAVRHAYPDRPGMFEVEVFPAGGELTIVVRDFGAGMRAGPVTDESSLRLGLGLISELSSHFRISGSSEGTEVRMQLPWTPSNS